jgi:hypothetical protein
MAAAVKPVCGESLRAFEKTAPVERAVHVEIEEVQKFLRIIAGFLTFHAQVYIK